VFGTGARWGAIMKCRVDPTLASQGVTVC